jgi:hypothetical protein
MPNSIRIVQIGNGSLQIEIDEIHEISHSGPGDVNMDINMLGFRIEHIDEIMQVIDGTVVAFSGPQSKNIADKLASTIEEFINGYYYPANEVDLDQFTVRKLANEDICIVNGDHEVIISSEDVAELIRELGRLPRSHA